MLYLVTEKGPIFIVNVGDHLTLNKILYSFGSKEEQYKQNKQTKVRENEKEIERERWKYD